MHTFASAALRLLKDRNSREPMGIIGQERVEFGPDNIRRTELKAVPLVRRFISDSMAEISALPETPKAIDALLSSGTISLPSVLDVNGKPTQPTPEQANRFVTEHLLLLLVSYGERFNTFSYDEAWFSSVYVDYLNIWHSKQVRHSVFIPLLSFKSEVDVVPLSDSLSIIPFSPALKNELWDGSALRSPSIDMEEYSKCEFCLQSTYYTESPTTGSTHPSIPDAERAVLALRLLKAGFVSLRAYYDTIAPSLFGTPVSGGIISDRPPSQERTPYCLRAEDISILQRLFHVLSELSRKGKLHELEVCLRRFEQTYSRERDEDKIIDLTVGLESTILFGQREELKYRLGLRGSLLLNKRYPPDDSHKLLRTLYDIRSGIVHGGKALHNFEKELRRIGHTPSGFLLEVLQLVRATILEYIERLNQGESVAQIADSLDSEILIRLASNQLGASPQAEREQNNSDSA